MTINDIDVWRYEATEDSRQMTINDIDVWRSANELIKQHGADAGIHAAMNADRFLAKGDVDGAAVWKRIARAVKELQSDESPKGTFRH